MDKKVKLGKRHQCGQCGIKFYDLNRGDPKCPKCGGNPALKVLNLRIQRPVEFENDEIDISSEDTEIIPLDGLEEEFAEM